MNFIQKWTESSLILKIIIGMILGVVLGIVVPQWSFIGFFGKVFVEALKSIAPLLVFILVASAISQAKTGVGSKFKIIIAIFLLMNFIAAVVATISCFIFPVSIHLSAASTAVSPGGLADILGEMLLKIFSNPIKSLSEGEYLGILFWSIIIGIALRMVGSDTTKDLLNDIAEVFSKIVYFIIQFAPIGVMGLVFTSVCESGLSIFSQYGELILLIVGCILIMAFIINPLISALLLKRNPFPLVFTCLKESGVTAFFSRSSAANIPINMQLCENCKHSNKYAIM